MVTALVEETTGLSRRALIRRLAAAGFAAPAIAAMLADGAWAQDVATPVAEALTSPFTTIPPRDDPATSLAAIGIDQPLIPRGDSTSARRRIWSPASTSPMTPSSFARMAHPRSWTSCRATA